MDGSHKADTLLPGEQQAAGLCTRNHLPDGWDDCAIISDRDLPGSASWITDLQVVEVAAVLGGIATFVGSLAARFH